MIPASSPSSVAVQPSAQESKTAMTPVPSMPATPTDSSATTSAVASATTDATTQPLTYITPPPTVTIPPIPDGFTARSRANFRGQLPKQDELAVMPGAVAEMTRFPNYTTTFGRLAPSHDAADQTLRAAWLWSQLRTRLAGWEVYCENQEAQAWVQARALLADLSSAFAIAVKFDPSIAVTNPSLVQFFGAKAAIAKRGFASRAANKVEVKEGRAPYKGIAGKRRETKAAKAALAEKEAQSTSVAGSPVSAAAAPVTTVAAPAAAAVAAAPSQPTAPAAVPAVAVAPANGVAHS